MPRPVPFSLVVKNGLKMRSSFSGGMPQPLSRTRTVALPAAVLDEEVDAAALGDAGERVDRVVEDVGEDLAELLGVGDDGRAGDVVARDARPSPRRAWRASAVSAESTTVARFTGANV